MDKKKLTGDAEPAVIITVTKLPLDGNKCPKAPAAFPAPVTFKLHHITHLM
jgi:hypothetical protein